jgi:hypothetical protein
VKEMPVMASSKVVTSIYIDRELKQFLKKIAKSQNRTLTGQVEYILSQYRKGKEGKTQAPVMGGVLRKG